MQPEEVAHRNDMGFGANNLEDLGNDGEAHDLRKQATFY